MCVMPDGIILFWEIEIFFKEIKQLLKIESFLGTSANALLIRICIAMMEIEFGVLKKI